MKSSDSRTNSKYKSPYGCRTNSHCVKIMVQMYVVGFCFLQNHKIADISNKFSSHYDVVEQQLKSSTIGKLNSVNMIIVTFKSCFSFLTHNFTVASNLTIEDYAPVNGLPQDRGVGQPREIRLLKRICGLGF